MITNDGFSLFNGISKMFVLAGVKKEKILINLKNKQEMGFYFFLGVLFCCCFSCTTKSQKEKIFIPNPNIVLDEVKQFKEVRKSIIYEKREKDTITGYHFCNYLKSICNQTWTIRFLKKDTLKMFSLLEKNFIIRADNSHNWLNKVKFDKWYTLRHLDRKIIYECVFNKDSTSCSMYLSTEIVLYGEVDWSESYYKDTITLDNIKN